VIRAPGERAATEWTLNCPSQSERNFFATEMNRDIHTAGGVPEWLGERIPLGRGGHEEEFTAAVAFLLAPGYVNGQVIALDGGLTTR
jgi:NAD(P)-dependent dehydrogenase (short-subunit alcohol dehydrogenase family)